MTHLPKMRLGMLLFGLVLAGAMLVGALSAQAKNGISLDGESFDSESALKISQAAIGRSPGSYVFRDRKNSVVRLSDFRGKPLVVNFIYTSCSHSCPIITNSLSNAVDVAVDTFGVDSFNVVTIGFDAANDSPARMRHFARINGVSVKNWKFLSGDETAISNLARDLGFIYYKSTKGFDHLDQVTVIDSDGIVQTQVYGASFNTPLLVDPLKRIVFGTSTPYASLEDLIKKVRLFCTIYDPALDRYRFDYSIFIRLIVGATFLIALGSFLARELWRGRKRRKKTPSAGSTPA